MVIRPHKEAIYYGCKRLIKTQEGYTGFKSQFGIISKSITVEQKAL